MHVHMIYAWLTLFTLLHHNTYASMYVHDIQQAHKP